MLKQLLDENVHPLCIYGCLACLSRFGPHITKRILLPKVSEIAQKQRAKLAEELNQQQVQDAQAKLQTITLSEITRINLQKLEQICNQLAEYLQQNEISNIEDLATVQSIISQVFSSA